MVRRFLRKVCCSLQKGGCVVKVEKVMEIRRGRNDLRIDFLDYSLVMKMADAGGEVSFIPSCTSVLLLAPLCV
jgi:hypothetical protein